MLFEWDESKRQTNLAKHGIDFRDAMRVFDGPVFESMSCRRDEERTVAIGSIEGIEIVLVYVMRGKQRRIISARRAHRNERQDYANQLKGAN
ncbi:MAG: BrnT family toxin [Terriglobales bacterium]